MKVLAITPAYPPASRVGAWLATHQFLRHLVECDHEVTAFALMIRARAYELDGVNVVTTMLGKSHADVLAEHADVILCHAGDGGFGARVATDAGKPLVVMVHGAGYGQIPKSAALAVFNSRSLRDMSTRAGWDGQSIVCHPPVDVTAHRVEETGDAATLVNCSPDKGVRVAWQLAERMPDRKFIGVRGGYGRQLCPRPRNFRVLRTQTDMRTVWAQTRVLLAPSAVETWGMVGVEAMCSGIPVIAHPTPGLLESLGGAGIFVDRDDIDGWERELARLDDPVEYARASAAALRRVDELLPVMRDGLDRFRAAVEAL